MMSKEDAYMTLLNIEKQIDSIKIGLEYVKESIAVDVDWKEVAARGDFTQAVKLYADIFACGLLEAKREVSKYMRKEDDE